MARRWPVILSAITILAVATACSGAASPGGSGGSATAPASQATSPASQAPASAVAGAAGGGATGVTVQPGGDLCGLLGPGDFAAAGVAGAGTPKGNPSDNADYCVYAGVSGAGGGIELDVFQYASATDASAGYGDDGFAALDGAGAAAAGADKAGYFADQPGNTPGTTWDELRALKGKIWIVLSVPDATPAQLEQLAKLALERAAAIT